MIKSDVPFFIFAITVFVLFFLSVIAMFTGSCVISYNGFAVDKNDIVYLGFPDGTIRKFDNGKQIDSFSAQTSRGYDFTITNDNMVYIYCGDVAFFTDLDGNVQEKITENIEPLMNYRVSKSEFINEDGICYKKQFNFGRTRIVKCTETTDEVVYSMPFEDYCIKILVVVSSALFFVTVFAFVIKVNTKTDYKKHRKEISESE